jgi:hypothetical protein
MGGRYWNYFVPYEDDVGVALQKLRGEIFPLLLSCELVYGNLFRRNYLHRSN